MKIAIVDIGSFSLPYDYYYINELVKNEYEIDFYCSKTKYNGEYIEELKKIGVNVIEFKISSSVANKIMALKEYFKFIFLLLKKRNKYKYIHFIWSALWWLDIFLFLVIKIKLIFTFHNDKPHNYSKNVYFPYKLIYKLAKKVVFVSDFTRERFIKTYKVNSSRKIILVPHGILPISMDKNSIQENQELEKTIIFWGTVKAYKGIDVFLQMSKYEKFKKYNYEIIGKWDKGLYELKEKLLQYDNIKIIDKYISFSELETLFQRKAVFILPYKDATQSGVLYTLLNYQKVAVSSNVGENKQFFLNCKLDKLIFDRENIESIFLAIEYAFNNYHIVKQQLELCKQKYEWQKILNKNLLGLLYE